MGGEAVPNYNLCNKPQSKTLTGEVEYCRSHEHLGSWLSLECSMMKSSTLFECGPLPSMSSSRPPDFSHDICSQAFQNKKLGMPRNEAVGNMNFGSKTSQLYSHTFTVLITLPVYRSPTSNFQVFKQNNSNSQPVVCGCTIFTRLLLSSLEGVWVQELEVCTATASPLVQILPTQPLMHYLHWILIKTCIPKLHSWLSEFILKKDEYCLCVFPPDCLINGCCNLNMNFG